MKNTKIRTIAKELIYCFWDIYENMTEKDIDNMTDKQVKEFVSEHLEFIIGTNGIGELWEVEKEAIKELNLPYLLEEDIN